jgi:hypothetical protein
MAANVPQKSIELRDLDNVSAEYSACVEIIYYSGLLMLAALSGA